VPRAAAVKRCGEERLSDRHLIATFYGDDFTGSTDALEALAVHGLHPVLFLRSPSPDQVARFPDSRAVGVAGESRSRSPQWMSEHLPKVFQQLKALGPLICHYKVCSTFDSSPEVGSIGRALEDIIRAADLFRPIYNRTDGVDGWVSLEVSPLLAHDTASTLAAAKDLHAQAGRPNLFIKIPGTKEGLPAIEEAIFAGIPINVTLLFSREQYLAAAEAFLRGIERRIDAGLKPVVGSVASVFISRWDSAVMNKVPNALRDQLGIAVAKRTYSAYRGLMGSPRWQRVFNAGARPQRLLWASTGTKDPKASDVLYVKNLAAPFTVNTMPENTLKALADHGDLKTILSEDGGDCDEVLAQFAKAGIDIDSLAAQLQDEGAKSFVKSWNELMAVITSKSAALKKVVA
jgi:transaldolase